MKATFPLAALAFVLSTGLCAQESVGGRPMSALLGLDQTGVPTYMAPHFVAPSTTADPAVREQVPHDAQLLPLNIDPGTAGSWTTLASGDRIWRLRILSRHALGTELFFDHFQLPTGSSLYLYNDDGAQLLGGFTPANNSDFGVFATGRIDGEASIIEYFEPAEARGSVPFVITGVAHTYRDLDAGVKAQDCEVDVNCSPEGDDYTDQRDAVVRIRVVDNLGQVGFCTGSLVNNVRQDCKVYFLTANHCGTEADVDSAHFQLWKFYFKYQRTTCGTGTASANKIMTGCVKRASSNDSGGDNGSDFLLLEADNAIPATYNPFWNGWDATNTVASGAKCIHHPNGDEKKISTVNGNTSTSSWGGTANTHWRVTWAGTTNGHGVTEGGSSGSPLFNSLGRTIGTLTGGGSFCNSVVQGGESQPDYFGKLSYHWQSDPGGATQHLKTWLDPDNTGTTTLDGSYNPCSGTGINAAQASAAVTISPNPAFDRVRIEIPTSMRAPEALEVCDPAGRMISRIASNGRNIIDLDVNAWAAGPYVVRLIAGGTCYHTAKLLVTR